MDLIRVRKLAGSSVEIIISTKEKVIGQYDLRVDVTLCPIPLINSLCVNKKKKFDEKNITVRLYPIIIYLGRLQLARCPGLADMD